MEIKDLHGVDLTKYRLLEEFPAFSKRAFYGIDKESRKESDFSNYARFIIRYDIEPDVSDYVKNNIHKCPFCANWTVEDKYDDYEFPCSSELIATNLKCTYDGCKFPTSYDYYHPIFISIPKEVQGPKYYKYSRYDLIEEQLKKRSNLHLRTLYSSNVYYYCIPTLALLEIEYLFKELDDARNFISFCKSQHNESFYNLSMKEQLELYLNTVKF